MKPSHVRIMELQKEIDNLELMKVEAESEYTEADDLQLQYRHKRDAAHARMMDLQDEIEYRNAEITALGEMIKHARATA